MFTDIRMPRCRAPAPAVYAISVNADALRHALALHFILFSLHFDDKRLLTPLAQRQFPPAHTHTLMLTQHTH